MHLVIRIVAVVLAGLSGAALAERAATEAQARYYIYSALLTQAAPAAVAERVALGPELSKRWGMPPRGEGSKVYEALVSLTDGKPIEVRKATAEEVAAYGARPGLHRRQPLYAVDAGGVKLLVQYNLQENTISFVGERNTTWDDPKLLPPMPKEAVGVSGFLHTSAAPSAAGATRATSTRLDWIGLFAFDSAVLSAEARETLDRDIVAKLAAMEVLSIDVSGHADLIGPADYNQDLSERRADAVRAYLVERGLEPGKVGRSGFGKALPVKSCPLDMGRAALIECLAPNRRVVVAIAAIPK
jgi:outer membrane protein OmpA-like peptidoglycan-associated protein